MVSPPATHPPLTQPLPCTAPPAAPAAAAGGAVGPAVGGAQRWTVQWMTMQGAWAAAEAVGATGHEEGARALPALRGAAGPLALAPPPPPDAPAFDAMAYGVAPPLPPGRGAAAAADGSRAAVGGGCSWRAQRR